MEEAKIDRAAMGRLAKALDFICGPDHPTTVALSRVKPDEIDHQQHHGVRLSRIAASTASMPAWVYSSQ